MMAGPGAQEAKTLGFLFTLTFTPLTPGALCGSRHSSTGQRGLPDRHLSGAVISEPQRPPRAAHCRQRRRPSGAASQQVSAPARGATRLRSGYICDL